MKHNLRLNIRGQFDKKMGKRMLKRKWFDDVLSGGAGAAGPDGDRVTEVHAEEDALPSLPNA